MYYITVSNGLLSEDHRNKIGMAVWEFMWLLDKMTSCDEDGVGKVLGGKPIKLRELAKQLGVVEKTVSRNLNQLEKEGYISMTRTPYGHTFKVYKAKKVFQKRTDKSVRSLDRDGTKVSDLKRTDINVRNKEDNTALDNTSNTGNLSVAGKEDLNKLIELFEPVNPTYQRLFSNKTERSALERLVKLWGYEKTANAIIILPKIIGQPYAPKITTPYQLEKDSGKLAAFVQQKRSGNKNLIGIAL